MHMLIYTWTTGRARGDGMGGQCVRSIQKNIKIYSEDTYIHICKMTTRTMHPEIARTIEYSSCIYYSFPKPPVELSTGTTLV